MGKKRINIYIAPYCDMMHAIFLDFQKGLKKSLKCNLQNMLSISDERARKAKSVYFS